MLLTARFSRVILSKERGIPQLLVNTERQAFCELTGSGQDLAFS